MFVSLVKSQIASVRTGLNQLCTLEVVWFFLRSFIYPLKKFAIYFSRILKIYVLKTGENSEENIIARLAKILKLEHRVAVFSKTFYLLRQQK